MRPKSIKVSGNLLKSFVLGGELVNEIGRHLSRGHHPSEVKVHTPRCQVNYFINPVPTHSDASARGRVLRIASACRDRGSSSCHLLTSCYLEVRMLCHPPPHPTAPPHAHLLGSVCPWMTDWPVLPLHLLRRSSWLLHCARSTSPGSPLWVSVPRFGGFHLCVKLVRTPPPPPNVLEVTDSMAEGVRPEDYCDEPVEDEFGEIIKCRSGRRNKRVCACECARARQRCTANWKHLYTCLYEDCVISEQFVQILLMWLMWGIVRPDWEWRHYMDETGPAPYRRQGVLRV